jgi:hypothetical protein
MALLWTPKIEQLAWWAMMRFWSVSEDGPMGWCGDRCDDIQTNLRERRARKNRVGKHMERRLW